MVAAFATICEHVATGQWQRQQAEDKEMSRTARKTHFAAFRSADADD
jgi:hypothetical protein